MGGLFRRHSNHTGVNETLAKLSIDQALLKAKSHAKKGEIEEAKKLYQSILKAFPKNVRAQQGLARLNAAKSESSANQAPPKERTDALIALYNSGRFQEVVAQAEALVAQYPSSFVVWNILAAGQKALGRLAEAEKGFRKAAELNPTYAGAYNNMGNALREQGKLDEAIVAYHRALEIKPAYAEAYNNMGNALKEQGKLDEAIAAYHRALEIKPAHAGAEAQMLHQQQHICDFTVGEQLKEASSRLGIETEAVTPFSALPWEDNSNHHQLRAMKWSREKYKQSPLPLPARPKTRSERIKIGYLSADFHDHATMYLMAGLLRQHDRSAFETFAYSYGRIKSGGWRKRAENDVDHFFDVTDQTDRQIADVVRSHALDIAIDLKGYTQHTRSQLFQYRLAPIQINYLGFPGSMGAGFIDYIIADPVVIPAEQRQFYSEKVIYLPHSYQPNDNERPIAAINTNRSDVGLPEDAFVFCCFNNNYKISPAEFDIWMRLLHKVDGSVLWLLRSNKWAESNLRKEAATRGIDPTRLVFAPKLPHSEHLARHKHADLFIDTFNYNAHTTASDALWSGLPVVTKQGEQFAARVAASLLTAVGLPELIAETEEQYEKRILELAENADQLSSVKAKLKENRLNMPLFDTQRYTRNFERGLTQVYDLYFHGKEPEDIVVTEDEV